MDIEKTTHVLGALAQETRLRVFRLLVTAGPEGMPATEIADALDVRRNLMSTHLGILSQTGLTTSRRSGRQIFHAVNFETTRQLIAFLVQDCCQGRPEACGPLIEEILPLDTCSS